MSTFLRILRSLPLLVLAPFLLAISALALALEDLAALLFPRRFREPDTAPDHTAASIVIPNWNGRDLLEKYLPSVLAATAGNPRNEVIVVENGSTDGSAGFLREHFPEVRLLELPRNLGFGGGSNAGFRAATNDIVVLLNSDMRVDPGFLEPLLEGFADPRVFSVACQIFFSDPERKREETGLTQGWWKEGALRVRHRIDPGVEDLFPCFYGGGGSCAFDRRKFLELGGFDPLLAPFYLEDTDLGYMAWKRGWQVLYQPRSIVYHEHRGTIGRHFTPAHIQAVYRKNFVLFTWKNIHEWRKLASHFLFAFSDCVLSAFGGDTPTRGNAVGIWRAFQQLGQALGSRWRARALSRVTDTEAFLRPLGGYFRDRFQLDRHAKPVREPRILFLSPYPICPPVHGGAVFMSSTLHELTRRAEVHLIAMLELPEQVEAHAALAARCASAEFILRERTHGKMLGTPLPKAVREFASDDLDWLVHRQIYTRKIDVLQLEYTSMAQYAGRYRHIANVLFEHDVYFQSVGRSLKEAFGPAAAYEYLRALHYELRALRRMDRIHVCTRENREYLVSFLPKLSRRIEAGLRAGVEVANYTFCPGGREPQTMLFVGSFRHLPNQWALEWFANAVLPRVLEQCPGARLVVVGSEPPARLNLPQSTAIEFRGFVGDVREPLSRYSVFVCPVMSGSGVRVKLLEAFACGIPVVSTHLGAEGLARTDGEFCLLADTPDEFAAKLSRLLSDPEGGREMAERARREVETNWDTAILAGKLLQSYRRAIEEKRPAPVIENTPIPLT